MLSRLKTDDRLRKIVRPIFGVFIGGALGYAYFYFIGCSSGGCPITSNPFVSTFWGALLGGVALS